MTDLDPFKTPPSEGSELPSRVARDERDRPRRGSPLMDGPTGHAPTTESVGDPDRHSVTSGGESGAAGGAMAGAAVGGPIGLPIGAAAGAVVGAAGEVADEDESTNEDEPLSRPGSEGTAPIDPARRSGHPGMTEEGGETRSDRR